MVPADERPLLVLLFGLGPGSAAAQSDVGSIRGAVVDQLGAGVEATVTLLRDGQRIRDTRSDSQGAFSFTMVQTGRYRVGADSEGFSPALSSSLVVGVSADVRLTLRLQIGPIVQHVVVTASAAEVPQSQVGSPVTVIDGTQLQDIAKA